MDHECIEETNDSTVCLPSEQGYAKSAKPTASSREDSSLSKYQAQEERRLRLDISLVSRAAVTSQGIPCGNMIMRTL
jgi:hypothetical protein